jgi:hypothetical protein
MIPDVLPLDTGQAEELLQITLRLIDDCLRTGKADDVLAPVALLNASRLMLVPQYAQEPRVYAALGMLQWIRYQRKPDNDAGAAFEAAFRFFTHVYKIDLGVLPDGLREQFAVQQPPPEPVWEVWHSLSRTLMIEYVRDRGERLLDQAIRLMQISLAAAPAACEQRVAMEHNLGNALGARFALLKERDDLDASVAALQRAAQAVADAHPHHELIWSALGDTLRRRFASTNALADLDAAIAAYRVALPLKGPVDDGSAFRWTELGSSLWQRFDRTRDPETLAEAIQLFQTVADQVPQDYVDRPDVLSALSGLHVHRHQMNGELADLHAAIEIGKAAVAATAEGSKRRAELARNVDRIYEQFDAVLRSGERPTVIENDIVSRLRPYVAPPELLAPEALQGAPEILPGIVIAIAVADGGRLEVLSARSAIEIARVITPEAAESALKVMRQLGIENLRRDPFPPVERLDDDTFVLEAEEPFVASRITFLQELVAHAAPGRPMTRGVLLAMPRRQTVLLHLPSGPTVLPVLERMKAAATQLFEMTPQSKLSPHVYYVTPDGHGQIVFSPTAGGPFTTLLFGEGGLIGR